MRPIITAIRSPTLPLSNGYTGQLQPLTSQLANYFVQIYIDDILLLTQSKLTHNLLIKAVLTLLADTGILCHPGKCELAPVPSISYLGMQLDIPNQKFTLTSKQEDKLRTTTSAILAAARKQQRAVSRRELAMAIGYY